MRMQIERELRKQKPEDDKARDQIGRADGDDQQQRIAQRRLKRRTHTAFSPNASFKSIWLPSLRGAPATMQSSPLNKLDCLASLAMTTTSFSSLGSGKSLCERLIPLFGNASKLGAKLVRIDAVGAHHGADQRIVQHVIECQFVVAKSHAVLRFLALSLLCGLCGDALLRGPAQLR